MANALGRTFILIHMHKLLFISIFFTSAFLNVLLHLHLVKSLVSNSLIFRQHG